MNPRAPRRAKRPPPPEPGTPVVTSVLHEKDPKHGSRTLHDMFQIEIPDASDPKARLKMRRALLRRMDAQIDMLFDGTICDFSVQITKT
jgi:hypothetical protein